MRLAFDIETNGLLPEATRLWCICAEDLDTGQAYSWEPHQIPEALATLTRARFLVAHNGLGFDFPALELLAGWKPAAGTVLRDSQLVAAVLYADIKTSDYARRDFPRPMIGRHSLAAWGHRLGLLKGDPGDAGFDRWTPEMQAYCARDVAVLAKLWRHLEAHPAMREPGPWLQLEHDVAPIIARQVANGFLLDVTAAQELAAELAAEKAQAEQELAAAIGGVVHPGQVRSSDRNRTTYWHQPPDADARQIKKADYEAATTGDIFGDRRQPVGRVWAVHYPPGCEHTPVTIRPFNANSRQQIAAELVRRGWEPESFTDTGLPEINEATLGQAARIAPEIARPALRALELTKLHGMVAGSDNSWLNLAGTDGRVHGAVNTVGTRTGRMTHSRPNMAQVPSSPRFRRLYTARPGWYLVGADADALELRCLAGYLARYDGGAYIRTVCEGRKEDGTDVHTSNQRAAGLATRDQAKTFIYALIYGGGDETIGAIVGKGRGAGRKLKRLFFDNTPGAEKLLEDIKEAAKRRGHLVGIDGRPLACPSQHSAPNTVLQGAGAVIMKIALVETVKRVAAAGIEWGEDWALVANVHDEFQAECRTREIAETVGRAMADSIQAAGLILRFPCPITGSYEIGRTWADTH